MKELTEKVNDNNEFVEFDLIAIRAGFLKQLENIGLLRKKRVFRVYPATAQMISEVAKCISSVEMDESGFLNTSIENIDKNSLAVCKVLAIMIVRSNGGFFQNLRVDMLASYFKKQLTGRMMVDLFNIAIKQMDLSKFIAILASIAPSKKQTE